MPEDLSWFSDRLQATIGPYVSLNEAQIQLLYTHYKALLLWNSKMNLTSVRSPEEIVVRHYCESLFFAAHLPADGSERSVADIGSGAGFPGLPLAVLRPDWDIALVESNIRKAVFLRESTRAIRNIRVVAERGEAVSTCFDWITSRAVKPMEVLALTPVLSARAGLLVGGKDWKLLRGISDFNWSVPVLVPWGDRRLCVYGTRFT